MSDGLPPIHVATQPHSLRPSLRCRVVGIDSLRSPGEVHLIIVTEQSWFASPLFPTKLLFLHPIIAV
jgi:hypothetical protein